LCVSGCPTVDLGSAVGDGVLFGTNEQRPDGLATSCAGSGGRDLSARWRAPRAGCFTISTDGSTYDTVLALSATCGAPEYACNDDAQGTTSYIEHQFAA